ncbi:major facilitator superfamily domain-containing protein [Roridomyces roridus]|uniref:Major facilitator superfamily domain-containing protein n=1 Tax=Roridomyces roridus TaxID=1738132 RepID=A0AAD7CG58_9AGAR|nr:major facilitator superfamily domain-containing protein [Roridomyces roridus]
MDTTVYRQEGDDEGLLAHPSTNLNVEKTIVRRIDWRLLPILGMLYALALIDRTNISIARVVGLDRDLDLGIGQRFSIVLAVYFIPYTLFQIPSNLLLNVVGPRKLLSFCVVGWGTAQLAMGFVPNWQSLAALRVVLGALEAGFLPSLVYLVSTWYTRHEVQTRLAIFYVIAIVLAGFSAFFAYALSLLSGVLGLAGWAWIFVIEGAITILFGVVAWFFLPGFPDHNEFLSTEETKIVLARVENDRGDSLPDQLTWEKFVAAFDWRVMAYSFMFLFGTISTYGVGFFVSLILRGLGWGVAESLLLSGPPFVFAGVSAIIFSRLSDHYQQRALFIAIQTLITILGWSMTGFAPSGGWRYVGLFLSNAGCSGTVIGILAYSSNNIVSHSKRAIVSAVIVSFGAIGGFVASYIFTENSAPRYLPGIIITIVTQVLLLMVLASTTWWFRKQNALAVRESMPEGFFYTL